MSTSRLIRLGGLAVFLGAALWAVQRIAWTNLIGPLEPWDYPQPTATVLWLLGLVVGVLILLGLPALYVRQAEKSGTFGLVAFTVIFVGMALVTGNAYFGAFIQDGLADLFRAAEGAGLTVEEPVMAIVDFMLAQVLQIVGWFLFGVATLRARVFPRWAAVLVMIGTPISLFMIMALELHWWQVPLFEIGLAALGFSLWRGADARVIPEREPAA